MCGIAGIIGPEATESRLVAMLQTMAHRGEPALFGERRIAAGAVVGLNRLGIVDPASRGQPFASPDGRVVCVQNGEIYNHRELRADLAPYPFRSACDTEVILAGYLRWGIDVVRRLRGMFAFAIVDHGRPGPSLFMARDPLGIKPLYFARSRRDLLFASELKAFRDVETSLITALGPGMRWVDGVESRFWSLPGFATNRSDAPEEEVAAAFRATVAAHLPERGTTAVCLLSGGVDSSSLLRTIVELHDGPVEAWTLAAANGDSADLRAADRVCSHLAVPLHLVSPTVEELTRLYFDGVWMTETWEPALVRNAVSYHALCLGVRDAGFKVCLSGEGADEVFGGYDYLWQYRPHERDAAIAQSLREVHRTYLQMADRASMHATLEVRVPYMDQQFVAACVGLPGAARLRGTTNKWSLRHAFTDLPEEIRLRPKVGMNGGAGYGSNDPDNGIYATAISELYRRYPERFHRDRTLCVVSGAAFSVDMSSCEEIYNFARYTESGFTRLTGATSRPQLNTSALRPAQVV